MPDHGVSSETVKAGGRKDDSGNDVWINVGGRSSVLDVALAVCCDSRGWNAEGRGSVSSAV